jgi:hypothetical protein
MSMELMVKAMKAKVGNPLRKLVLIKLADNANDNGECWPSYQHIADQCEITRRSVVTHVNKLEEMGFLVKQFRKGVKGNSSNIFHLSIPSAILSSSANNSLHGESNSLPSESPAPPPSEFPAPRTSHSFESVNESINEPILPKQKKRTQKTLAEQYDLSQWPTELELSEIEEYLQHRKKMKKPSMSQNSITRIGKKLKVCVEGGLNASDCLAKIIDSGWQGFEPDWLLKDKKNAQQPRTAEHLQNGFHQIDQMNWE